MVTGAGAGNQHIQATIFQESRGQCDLGQAAHHLGAWTSPVLCRGLGTLCHQKLEASRDDIQAEKGLVNCRGKGLANCRGVHRLSHCWHRHKQLFSPRSQLLATWAGGCASRGGLPELGWHLLQLMGGAQSLPLETHRRLPGTALCRDPSSS